VAAEDRDERAEMIDRICTRSAAQLVQRIGHVAVLFRRNPDQPKIELPPA
jgi:RNA-binding protein